MKLFKRFLMRSNIQNRIDTFNRVYHNSFKQHALDGALLEYFILQLQKSNQFSRIDCVQCATATNIYGRIHVFIPNGVEYCIRNEQIISNYGLE
jgi:hypothetical protein